MTTSSGFWEVASSLGREGEGATISFESFRVHGCRV